MSRGTLTKWIGVVFNDRVVCCGAQRAVLTTPIVWRYCMAGLVTLASCVALAASHYAISPTRIDAAITAAQAQSSADRIGPMGIPSQWMPYLRTYGFDVSKVNSDACENVIAGTWILATTDRLMAAQRVWASESHNLPERAKPWQFTVRWIAAKAGISPSLVNSVIEQESHFNPDALGPRTKSGERAVGLMQIMPSTARKLGINPYDPVQNLWGGTWYLANLLRAYAGNAALALAAYNAGPGAVSKYGGIPPYRETQNYVPTVLWRAEQYAEAGVSAR